MSQWESPLGIRNWIPDWPKSRRRLRRAEGEGLFVLATERFDSPLASSLAYWRDFAGRYLTELCHTPEGADVALEVIPPPAAAELTPCS